MSAALLLLRRSGTSSGLLAILAFAASGASLSTVLGGIRAFSERAGGSDGFAGPRGPSIDGQLAPLLLVFALIAGVLLVPSAASLGASAARLSLSRRERDLAKVRLVGGTTAQVVGIALLDVLVQGAIGTVVGIIVHLGAAPLLTALDFGVRRFSVSELLLPWWAYPLLVAGVLLLAVTSAVLGLIGIAITPLGVSRGSRRVRVSLVRLLLWGAILVAFVVVSQVNFPDKGLAIAIMVVLMGLVLAGLNLIGPLVVWLTARAVAALAPSAALLVGARRLAVDPRAGWRSVSGISFGLVAAGMLTLISVFARTSRDPVEMALGNAMMTGGYLTLGIAALLAAVSTGVTQAARVLDQAGTYRAQHVGGAEIGQLHRARIAEVAIPTILSSIIASVTVLVLLIPAASAATASWAPLLLYIVATLAAYALVVAAVAASGPLVGRAARGELR